MSTCNRLALTAYLTGDLDPKRRIAIERHLAACGSCRGALERMRKERDAFNARMPFDSVIEAGRRPTSARSRLIKPWYALAAGLVLAVGALTVLQQTVDRPTYRTKGAASIQIHVMSEDGTPDTRKDHRYLPGERIQISYSCGRRRYFMLLSIDQDGRISTYSPNASDSSIALQPGAAIPLPYSIELDEYRGAELFVAVFSSEPVALTALKDRLAETFRKTGDLDSLTPLRLTVGDEVIRVQPVTRAAR